MTPVVPRPDCGSATPLNCDTAIFTNPLAEYTLIVNANGSLTVIDNGPAAGNPNLVTGTDTLLNIEQLQFSDVTIPNPAADGGVRQNTVPNVVGLSQADATAALTGADFVVVVNTATSTTVPAGTVISQNPAGGTTRNFGSNVTITVSIGTVVPNVVNALLANATTTIIGAGLTVGSVTQEFSNTVAINRIISQSPASGTTVQLGTAVALAVSLGAQPKIVPNVVGLTQANATTAIQNAGLVVGALTSATSATIPLGSVISSSPVAGTSVPALSAVNLQISLGAPTPAGLVLALAFDEASGTVALDSSASQHNGTIRQATRTAGKIGGALRFDGVDDWVTVTDTTASPLDLSTGMTVEAWVNPTVMSGWECGVAGEGLLSYALYAHDGAPLAVGQPVPAGYVRLNPVASTTDRAVRGTTKLTLGVWTHLATTVDGTNQRFYVNGVLVGTTASSGTIAVSNGALRIGGNASSTGEFFQGLIDEVRVYNRALSAAEIVTDMTAPIVR